MKTLKEIMEAKIDWKKELAQADVDTKHIEPDQPMLKQPIGHDDSPISHDKTVGLYKADPTRNVMSELEVQKRANDYIKMYQNNGCTVQDIHKNADGSYSFTTIKGGVIKHHSFHKTGGRSQTAGGTTTAHDEEDNKAVDDNQKIIAVAKGRGRPAGALGAAKRSDAGASGTALQDILMKNVMKKLPQGKKRLVKFKESLDESRMSELHAAIQTHVEPHIKAYKDGKLGSDKFGMKLYHAKQKVADATGHDLVLVRKFVNDHVDSRLAEEISFEELTEMTEFQAGQEMSKGSANTGPSSVSFVHRKTGMNVPIAGRTTHTLGQAHAIIQGKHKDFNSKSHALVVNR